MAALAPLAIYGPALWPSLRSWRRFALVAIGFSVGIELTQLAGSLLEGFTYRVTDIDDVILNSSGAVVAFFIWREMERRGWADPWLDRLRDVLLGSTARPAPEPAPQPRPTRNQNRPRNRPSGRVRSMAPDSLASLAAEVAACRSCPRLVEWREKSAANPPARFAGESYWARPLPGFGTPGPAS